MGRTGLTVSVAGLGCGGPSRIGQGTGASERESIALVRHALDLGVTLLDTAAAYGTEGIVGQALAGVSRDDVVVSTKSHVWRRGPDAVIAALESSLKVLGLDYVDVFHVHGVVPDGYEGVRDEVFPASPKWPPKTTITRC